MGDIPAALLVLTSRKTNARFQLMSKHRTAGGRRGVLQVGEMPLLTVTVSHKQRQPPQVRTPIVADPRSGNQNTILQYVLRTALACACCDTPNRIGLPVTLSTTAPTPPARDFLPAVSHPIYHDGYAALLAYLAACHDFYGYVPGEDFGDRSVLQTLCFSFGVVLIWRLLKRL